MKKRLLTLLMVVAMACSMLTGCAAANQVKEKENVFADSATKTDDGIVDLTVWVDAESIEMVQEMAKSFETLNATTKFSFTFVAQGEGDCKNVLLADMKNAGDVFAFADDQLTSFIAAGVLSKVPNSGVASANTAESVDASKYKNELYAYPMTADNGYFLYYNKKYFTEEDLKTLDGILAVCAANGKTMTMDLSSGWYLYSFFGNTGLTMGLNADGVTNHCNWNATTDVSGAEVSGAEITQAIADIIAHPGFQPGGDADFQKGIVDGSVIAGVTGVWNAVAVQDAWGEDYGAVQLPTYTVAGKQIQMASFIGFKMVGVNAYSEEVEWAHKFADYITNEKNQTLRFVTRSQGPSNIKAAASEEVSASPAIQAVIAQSAYGTLQRVGNSYWDACTSYSATLVAGNPDGKPMQDLIDILVEGITKSVAQ